MNIEVALVNVCGILPMILAFFSKDVRVGVDLWQLGRGPAESDGRSRGRAAAGKSQVVFGISRVSPPEPNDDALQTAKRSCVMYFLGSVLIGMIVLLPGRTK